MSIWKETEEERLAKAGEFLYEVAEGTLVTLNKDKPLLSFGKSNKPEILLILKFFGSSEYTGRFFALLVENELVAVTQIKENYHSHVAFLIHNSDKFLQLFPKVKQAEVKLNASSAIKKPLAEEGMHKAITFYLANKSPSLA